MRRGIVFLLVFLVPVGVWYFLRNTSKGPSGASPDHLPQEVLSTQTTHRELAPPIRALQNQDWGDFRRAYPYAIQVIAASGAYPDGSRTLIVSEPPPHVTLGELKAVDPTLLSTEEIKTHTVGNDGWVKDVLFNLPAGLDEQGLKVLVGRLSNYLFETNYGAYCLPLPINLESLHTKYPLDLRIGVAELSKWASQTGFARADGQQVPNLQLASTGGIYLSSPPGVVAWLIQNGTDVATRKAEARRFALDSDLILGAVQLPNKAVAVLARERIVPVDVLPPLRAETIALLAGAGTNELSQSYERNAFFAGKFQGPWDWAPAYLSPQLIDTEYGSLLNIADQLLKSWTQHGEIRYQSFPYPDPARFPFDQSLMAELDASMLLFNWNTTGLGFTVNMQGLKVYGINRTGALPVMYRPDDKEDDASVIHGDAEKVKRAEESGYDYFATRNDPVLARVVQYAALYQSFRALEVRGTPATRTPTPDGVQAIIRAKLYSVLRELAQADEKTVRTIARARAKEFVQLQGDPRWNSKWRALSVKILEGDLTEEVTDSFNAKLLALRLALSRFYETEGDRGLDCLCQLATASRGADLKAMVLRWGMPEPQLKPILELFSFLRQNHSTVRLWGQLDDVRRNFSAAWGDNQNSWIHTQTVVVSRGEGESIQGTGGHNVDSTVTPFALDKSVQRGTVQRLRDGTVVLNPEDALRAPELVRAAARARNDPNIIDVLNKQLRDLPARTPEPQAVTLGFGDRPPRTRRGFGADHVPPSDGPRPPKPSKASDGPPEPPDGVPPPHADPPSEPPADGGRGDGAAGGGGNDGYRPQIPSKSFDIDIVGSGLFVERRNGKVFLYRESPSGKVVAEMWNTHDAQSAVLGELAAGGRAADREPLTLFFGEGFERVGDAEAFLKSLFVQAARYPGAREVIIFKPMSRQAMVRLNSRLSKVAPHAFEVAMAPDGLQLISGSAELTAVSGAQFRMGIEAKLLPSEPRLSVQKVNEVIAGTAKRAQQGRMTPLELGKSIYEDLGELTPGKRAPGTTIKVEDAGDFTIILDDLPNPPHQEKPANPQKSNPSV